MLCVSPSDMEQTQTIFVKECASGEDKTRGNRENTWVYKAKSFSSSRRAKRFFKTREKDLATSQNYEQEQTYRREYHRSQNELNITTTTTGALFSSDNRYGENGNRSGKL